MASCEFDYRLSNSSESMEYEETDSDDDSKLQIVEAGSPSLRMEDGGMSSKATLIPRTLMRSLSAVESMKEDYHMGGGLASDAVESLLLLGQTPIIAPKLEDKEVKINGNQRVRGSRFAVEQRMMVNYYQRMRERNNEASKRCRLKRRIKQDSLEKTRLLLESQKDTLKKRVAKLHKIKEILSNACRATGNDASSTECLKFCNLIKSCQRDMPDCNEYSNLQLIKKSRFIRETNLEEIIGAQAPDLNDLRPLKRGPRKVDTDTNFTIDPDTMSIKPESPSVAGPMDLSSGSKTLPQPGSTKPVNLVKIRNASPARQDGSRTSHKPTKPTPVTYVTLAPKTSAIPIPSRTVIVDNPNNCLPQNVIPINIPGGAGTTAASIYPADPNMKSTISLSNSLNINGTTILVTPIGGGAPILNLPLNPLAKPLPDPPQPFKVSPKPPPMELLINKTEPEVVIKSEPEFEETNETEHSEDVGADTSDPETSLICSENIKTEEEEERLVHAMEVVDTKLETEDRDPSVSCAAVLADKEDAATCSGDLVDLNSLTQTLDLVTMEPRSASALGDLTSAEKYIIKSRLEMAFWKAEEGASVICAAHRAKIVQATNLQACSVCGKKRSKKLDMYIITYRMSVEFYMTNGQFLSIGQLACSSCKGKNLKGLDFSNSYILPEVGHPLQQMSTEIALPLKAESGDAMQTEAAQHQPQHKKLLIPREIILHRDVVLPSSGSNQAKLATIQPLPQKPQARVAAHTLSPGAPSSSASVAVSSSSQTSSMPDSSKAKKDLHDALMALNPDYKPLGFTIDSLASCSDGVLNDTLRATKAAMTTILSTIAPGQECSLWQLIKPEMEKICKSDTQTQL